MIIIQIFRKLFFAATIIFLTMPDFQFQNALLPAIVYYYIRSLQVSGLRLNVIISASVYDGLYD